MLDWLSTDHDRASGVYGGSRLSICGTDENQLALNSILGMATKRAWNISRGGKLSAGEK